MERGKVFASCLSDRGLVFGIYEECKHLTAKKNHLMSKEADKLETFPKKISKWPIFKNMSNIINHSINANPNHTETPSHSSQNY